ncbi:hypothetical protein JZO81_15050 [Enterococcus hulanensis]|uniref:hypothetical protein n=1 Tax=Enterococcus hulanensis TaxID=2559929 RepID=UPI001A928D9D|nr:hypothetical protein [Enterococcus hulanensis]MBO0412386.1 hypothetical protein [Enterococcus hulanensis]
MIISPVGYGGTGSGAVFSLLKEIEGIQSSTDNEFGYTYQVDGLEDLRYHLMENYSKSASGDAAIQRFIQVSKFMEVPFLKKTLNPKDFMEVTYDFVNEITQSTYLGMQSLDLMEGNLIRKIIILAFKKFVIKYYQTITKRTYNFWPIRKNYVSIAPENFNEASKKYIDKILELSGFDLNQPILLNQAFSANSPQSSFQFYDDPKVIIVDRDPRDLYLQHEELLSGEGRWMPKHNVEAFVAQYLHVRKFQKRENTKNLLFLQFEDLIYKYDETVNAILNFIGSSTSKHINKKEFFKPELSISNTQLFNYYKGYEKDVEYIEKNLSTYIYDYSSKNMISRIVTPFNA